MKNPTPEEVLGGIFNMACDRADAALKKFQEKLEIDPVGAFRWADGLMEGIVKADVARIHRPDFGSGWIGGRNPTYYA